MFTNPFWLQNSSGEHEQNQNDVIFHKSSFWPFAVVSKSCGHGRRRPRLKAGSGNQSVRATLTHNAQTHATLVCLSVCSVLFSSCLCRFVSLALALQIRHVMFL